MNLKAYQEDFTQSLQNSRFHQSQDKALTQEQWLEHFLQALVDLQERGAQLFFIGNGASASMASHFATDFTKNARIAAHTLHDGALLTCFANDYSYPTAFAEMLKVHFRKGDALVAISSSGKSPNVLQAAEEVSGRASHIFTFSGFLERNPLWQMGSLNLYVPNQSYGPVEVIHSYYLHCVLDFFCARREGKA